MATVTLVADPVAEAAARLARALHAALAGAPPLPIPPPRGGREAPVSPVAPDPDRSAGADAAASRLPSPPWGGDGDGGRVGLILSGGRTPQAVLPLLLAEPGLDWTRIAVAAGDERLVPAAHPDSTEGMIRGAFAAAGRPLAYHGPGPDLRPGAALDHWRAGIAAMPWPPAVAFLGMGEDGHVASLFPGRPEAGDAGLFAAPVPETAPHAHPRLTLGPAALLALPRIILVAAGAAKRAMLDRAMDPGADPRALPLAWIARLPQTEVLCPIP